MEPEYRQAAAKLKGLAKLVQVDCDNSSNKNLCAQYGIQGFPTLKIFSAGSKGMPEGLPRSSSVDYRGERTAKAIKDALTPMIPGRYVQKIGGTSKKSLSLEDFKKAKDKVAKVILVTDKKSTPTLFKALSIEYLKRLTFGEVRKTESDIVASLNVEKYPTVLVLTDDSPTPVVYDGILFDLK